MTRHSAAIAVFVKTPGLSPIKTRLAAGIGAERSAEFYRLSVAAVAATVAAVTKSSVANPYWAVAEEAGLDDPLWQQFPRVSQGSGGLGERLSHVFAELACRHDVVIAIGADSPQITPELIRKAFDILRHDPLGSAHVVGRCHDGGFYLVGTNGPLQPAMWRDVPYSTPSTADRLVANLGSRGTVHQLIKLSDVDEAEDLAAIKDELNTAAMLSPEQRAVLEWVKATHAAIV